MDMQSTARKVTAIFVAAMMVFAMAFIATPAKAFAAGETGTLTVESANAAFDGKTAKAWKMFGAKASGDGLAATYELDPAWNEFFTGTIGLTNDTTLSQKAYEYVAALDNAAKRNEFALKASAWAANKPLAETATSAAAQLSGGKYQAVFNGLPFGYYLVVPVDTKVEPAALLVNVVTTTGETATLKSVYPTVDKKAEGKDHASAQVGDKVTFTLESVLPDSTDYKTYTFKFKDTLSKGLTFVDGSVAVQIEGEQAAVEAGKYKVTNNPADGNLVIELLDYKTNYQKFNGKKITVTYEALINENAAVLDQDNPNKATVEYTTDPTNGGTGTSEPSIVHTYTFGFDVDKIAAGEVGTKLAGAVFELQTDAGKKIDLVKVSEGVFRPAKSGEQPVAAAEDVKTDAQGKLQFVGLKEGTYKLVETKAPDGYNVLKDPVIVVISANYNPDGTLLNWKADVQGGSALDGTHVIQVSNNKGALLPETGGMGTIAFTVVGALAIIGGVVWAVRRKRSVR